MKKKHNSWIKKLFTRKHISEPKIIESANNNPVSCNFKEVRIRMSWSTFGDDIVETDTVKVPIGLTEEEEKKFIDEYVWDNWHFLYGY